MDYMYILEANMPAHTSAQRAIITCTCYSKNNVVSIIFAIASATSVGGCNNEVAALLSDHYTEVSVYIVHAHMEEYHS